MSASQHLTELHVAGRRYEAMARKWYESKGKPYPGDPGKPIIEAVRDNAGFSDQRLARLVLPPR